jgi:hypothetical protein
VLAEDGSHSTDQSTGRAQGQGKGRVGSSKILREKHKLARLSILILSKAYPELGILSPQLDHESFNGVLGFVSAEKQQRVDPYFHILAFRF